MFFALPPGLALASARCPSLVASETPTHHATDGIFSDGAALELATITGGVAEGYTASLTVAV